MLEILKAAAMGALLLFLLKITPMAARLSKWKLVDAYRLIRYKPKPHIYGIRGYLGLPGAGKTMAMSYELERLRKKYGDKIYIYTNFYWKGQDKGFDDWRMLLDEYDKPCIFAWDEVQNEFNSRDFKNFPTELLTLLTQNRKGHGKRILWTAQRWGRVDKVFRELTQTVSECKTHFGRLTTLRTYDWEDYEFLLTCPDVNKKIKIKPKSKTKFVQTDKIRDSYDSFQMLKSAKDKQFISREERAKLVG